MMKRMSGLGVVLAGLMMAVAPAAAQEERAEADYSTPQAAAKTFAQALERGDADAVKAASIVEGEQEKLVEAMTGMVGSFRKLQEEAVKRYGEEEAKTIGQMGDETDWVEKVERAEVEQEGQLARLIDREEPEADPLQLRQVNGEWKVDLSAMMGEEMEQPEEIEQAVSMLTAMSRAATEVADEISAGQHETADAAAQAVQNKMFAIIMGAMQQQMQQQDQQQPRPMPQPQEEPAPGAPGEQR